MEQAITPIGWRFLFLGLVILAGFSTPFSLVAQQDPYLLLQGPSERTTMRFPIGTKLEIRLRGESEAFTARINALYPEAQAIRIDDYLLGLDKIASIKFLKNGAGFKNYLVGQGLANLGFIGIVYLASRRVRQDQENFVIGTSLGSLALVIIGSIGKRKTRTLKEGGKFILSVAGGDLRVFDDPDRI